jgi:hypothetical protein
LTREQALSLYECVLIADSSRPPLSVQLGCVAQANAA